MAHEESRPTATVNVSFTSSPNRLVLSPTGISGGPNFQRQIVAHLWVEAYDYPSNVKLIFDPNKGTAIEEGQNPAVVIREVQASLFLKPESAEAFGKWLLDQVKAAKAAAEEAAAARAKNS